MHAFCISDYVFSEFLYAGRFALEFTKHFKMPDHHGDPFLIRWTGRYIQTFAGSVKFPEHPRIAERSAAYHDHVTARFGQHAHA